ncbi:MAG: PEP-CTERM sorting domain-containing protein [Roseiarcus sp.]
MRSRTGIAACAAAAAWLLGLVDVASAGSVVFDSLGGANSGEADTSIDPPAMSATFKTGAAPRHIDVALSLSAAIPEPGDAYTVSLDGGVPLSDLSFDPLSGLEYLNGSTVDFQGPALASVTLPVASLPAAGTVEHYHQFEDVALNPDSLYWIEVRVDGGSVIEWGMTNDVSGPGVAGNYLAWFGTDDGFFRNDGVRPFAFDQALQMEVSDAVPEPSTWAMMLVGFAGLGFAGYRSTGTGAGPRA